MEIILSGFIAVISIILTLAGASMIGKEEKHTLGIIYTLMGCISYVGLVYFFWFITRA